MPSGYSGKEAANEVFSWREQGRRGRLAPSPDKMFRRIYMRPVAQELQKGPE